MATQIVPFLIVTGVKKWRVQDDIQTCSSLLCSHNKNNNGVPSPFCPLCGTKTYNKPYVYEADYTPEEMVSDKFEDDLIFVDKPRGEYLFVSNWKAPFESSRREDLQCGVYTDLTKINIEKEVAWFTKKHQKVIKYLKEQLGPNAVQIKWGTINT